MEAEEPLFVYNAASATTHLRGQIISRIEHEQNVHVLQHLYFVIEQLQSGRAEGKTLRKGLRSLCGVLKDNGKTYDEMRQEYMKERYRL